MLWSEFVRLNHIRNLPLLEQKRAYDHYQQQLLQEYLLRDYQLQQLAAGSSGASTPSVRAFSSAFSNAFN